MYNNLKYKCSFCDTFLRREKDLDKHEFQHNNVKKYSCNIEECTKKYILRAHLKRHVQTFHEKKIKKEKIKCKLETCNIKLSTPYNADEHFKKCHEKIKEFKCTECNNVYKRKRNLKLHQITHTKEYPLKCYICEKGFVNELIFKRHNCLKHDCKNCGERFKSWSSLKQHISENHIDFSCNICDKICNNKEELITHKKSHKERCYCTWEGCSRSYSNIRNLKSHINIKHLNKKFECTFDGCDKKLSTKSKLNYHLNLHKNPPESKIIQNTKKLRKKRKDAGTSKKSVIGLIGNFITTPEVDKILKNNAKDVIIEFEKDISIEENESDASNTNYEITESVALQLII